MIEVKNLDFKYGEINVLNNINFKVKNGEFLSIIGDSGAGKTTLLQLLGTLEKIQNGTIIINNKDISKLNERELSNVRNKEIGFVFQFHNLIHEFTALENICLPAMVDNTYNKKITEERAKELLKYLNIIDRANHKPSELSGGEQQRVAVARAMINEPSILLADEPSGNLDSKNAKLLHELLVKLNKEKKQTIIISSHNKNLIKLSDRILEIKDGKII